MSTVDVVERLLELSDLERIDKDTLFKLCGEAAEEIEQLRAKNERLQESLLQALGPLVW